MKKNIDHLFQEKLKNFNEVPDDKVWKSIEASLDKKKDKRRIIPIWWKLGGVAALLALLLYVINPFSTQNNIAPAVTDIENTNTSPSTKEKNDPNKTILTPENKEEFVTSTQTEDENTITQELIEKNSSYTTSTDTEAITNTSEKESKIKNTINTDNQLTVITPKNDSKQVTEEIQPSKTDFDGISEKNNTDIAIISDVKKEDAHQPKENETQNDVINDSKAESTKKSILEKQNVETAIVEAKKSTEDSKEDSNKKSIFDEIEKEEEELIAESNGNKWSLGASVAPVYFDGLGGGSPIDDSFAQKTKSGNVNLSYGLVVAYDISKKLSIRSGVHKVDYGYDTNDVSFTPSFDASANTLSNINYTQTSKNLVLESAPSNRSPLFEALDITADSSPVLDGNLVQQFGYLEVPLELNYALVDRKLGINIIGGISSLFLVDNAVILESEDLSTEIGEANNINSVNFSTNIGLGVNYEFSPKVQLNIEPVFKYQLNTFSNTSGDFQPYSLGIYSGFSIKF